MRKAYPNDITREQFEIIRKDLEGARKAPHPRKYDLYDIFCAILYLVKEGCTWRAIPHDYPIAIQKKYKAVDKGGKIEA